MIRHPAYAVEPWCLRETDLHLDVLAQSESVFALSNGHIGWRGNLDEGEPHGLPGTYLNGVYESRPLPYAEPGFGYPETGESVINVTNGKIIRLLVDDHPLDVRYGEVHTHERVLDFRTGLLDRHLEWTSAGGRRVRVHSTRLVSLAQRSVAAVCYDVEPVGTPVRIVLQSELMTNEVLPAADGDPRVAAVLEAPLRSEGHHTTTRGAALAHRTVASGLHIAAAMDHVVEGPASCDVATQSAPDLGRVTVTTELAPGERLRVVKYVAYGWSSRRSAPAVRDQVAAALAGARHSGWQGLVDEQRAVLDRFWAGADVEVDGDPEVGQAARFALFHVFQAGARAEGRAIPAKGLTGSGYDGHAFWDTETYVLPVLTYTAPEVVASALRWRHSTLPGARSRAVEMGLTGALFPWRTITGAACSSYWPAGTAAFHLAADIADAAICYVQATGDEQFEREIGVELLVETARLWCSLGFHDAQGQFRIDGVTGPDEYSAVEDNNLYTNLMAQHNLNAAAQAAERYPDAAHALGVDDAEVQAWKAAATAMTIPYDDVLGVHAQSEGFTRHEVWDFAGTKAEDYPLLLHFPYFDLYRKQVVKQADLVLAMQVRGEAFTDEEKARNFAYYEGITVRDSSLSACSQAVLAAEVGHLALAHDYLAEAALMDLDDLEHNTRDGLHIASLAGTWIALVRGFGGMRVRGGIPTFMPRLPEAITRLAFGIVVRNQRLRVEITPGTTTYRLIRPEAPDGDGDGDGDAPTSPAPGAWREGDRAGDGAAIELVHDGEVITLQSTQMVTRPNPRVPVPTPVDQPAGRAPHHHEAAR